MSDLISRSALIEKAWDADTSAGYVQVVDVGDILEAPAVDAVEVVRCKDCKHMEIEPSGRCCHVWGFFNGAGDDGFCNYGEKRDGERKDNDSI